MAASCDPNGLCPRCGYQNGPGIERCLRCHQPLAVPKGCSGACSRCLLQAIAAPAERPVPENGRSPRTKAGGGASI